MRDGCRDTFEQFLAIVLRDRAYRLGELAFAFCYNALLERVPPNIGIVARHYDRLVAKGVVDDLLQIVGLTSAQLNVPEEPYENPSLPIADTFLRFYRNRLGLVGEPTDEHLMRLLDAALGREQLAVSDYQYERIVAVFDRSNRAINARFADCALPTADSAVARERESGKH